MIKIGGSKALIQVSFNSVSTGTSHYIPLCIENLLLVERSCNRFISSEKLRPSPKSSCDKVSGP